MFEAMDLLFGANAIWNENDMSRRIHIGALPLLIEDR